MEFQALREDLLRALQAVMPAVEKSSLAILNNVLLRNDGDTALRITGSNLEFEITATTTVDLLAQPGCVAVDGRKFSTFIKALPAGALVTFATKDSQALTRSGRARCTLQTLSGDEFPSIQVEAARERVEIDQATLRSLLAATTACMAVADVRRYLNGACLQTFQTGLRVMSSDSYGVAVADSADHSGASPRCSVILPRKTAIEIQRLSVGGEAPVSLTLTERHMRADFGAVTLTSKLVAGRFPDLWPLINQPIESTVTVLAADLIGAIDRSVVVADKFRRLTLSTHGDTMRVDVRPISGGEEAGDEIPVTVSGPDVAAGFNGDYVLRAITALASEEIRMAFPSANGSMTLPVIFRDPTNPRQLQGLAQMRA